jgi:hypothetical protein
MTSSKCTQVRTENGIQKNHLSTLINITVDTGVFPDRLKKAQVTPLFKKNDPLVISNYRPVSILPIFSKLFEKVIEMYSSYTRMI